MANKPATNTIDTSVPHPAAAKHLSESEKRALELSENAEHETGQKREDLQKNAARKNASR